ncbi:DEAD/DEAH box helicase family protein [Aquimarina algiphila]|uniref:DEAD/DEAH box helicase n=1 Tax=Aquimarina algiphila TaxID=2047982 RepID=A0A554VIP7_9FLAO|nr:DEAD/DEAH box helicase family protein [Aquimarina algiphila]TSE07646.1 DEAD/DEAH box helicase [Aquimarina algiphila]
MGFFDEKNKEFDRPVLPIDPIELYYSFSKDNKYNLLWAAQEEVLKKWHEQRDSINLLIKMNTGAGKTLTGLIILYSKMLEFNKPVVYLCPDNQLLSQVVDQSKMSGIPTCVIDENNDFPEEFLNSEAILITTVNRMFNSKNIFDRDRVIPIAVLFDDAHRAVQSIIDSFTITIADTHKLYDELRKLFKEDLKKQSTALYEMLKTGASGYNMKVPYWAWIDKKDNVNALLAPYVGEKATLLFKWGLFHNNYDQHDLYFAHNKLEISPKISQVSNVAAYEGSSFKYALSATFVNDHAILKDLNFNKDSILNPIIPTDRKDYGERLILTPKRYYPEISIDDEIKILNHHIEKEHNVVILVPNMIDARWWKKRGAIIADKTNIEDVIDQLKTSKGNLVVFLNRYEGIDLSGDSCNVLVIYNHPKFRSLKNSYYEDIHHETRANYVAQTIEQGMGRSVRSGNDFSVVYLMGRDVLKFLRYKENHKFFNDHTQKQIRMGLNLMQGKELNDTNIIDVITTAADSCLSQETGWKTYYRGFMDKEKIEKSVSRELNLEINELEKKATSLFLQKENKEAEKLIHEIIRKDINPIQKAWYYQMLGNFIYPINPQQANNYQIRSKSISSHMLEPFMGKQQFKKQVSEAQMKKALDFIRSFDTKHDLLLFISEISKDLIYIESTESPDYFEAALKDLGKLLGYESSRPEKELKEGPDALWGSKHFHFILEAKSHKKPSNRIYKSEIEQLLSSKIWFKEKYITETITLMITLQANSQRENGVGIDENMFVIDQQCLDKLKDSISKLHSFISNSDYDIITEESIKLEYHKLNLNAKAFIQNYLKVIK